MPTAVDCPTCGRRVEWTPASKFRPFCSERCKMVDLGAWASERYAVPGESLDDPAQGPETGGPERAGGRG